MTCLYHCLPQKCFEAVNAGQKTKSFQNKLKANSCSQRFLDTSCFDQKQRPRGRPETKKQHQRKRHKIMTCLYHCLPQKCFEAVNAGKKTNRNKRRGWCTLDCLKEYLSSPFLTPCNFANIFRCKFGGKKCVSTHCFRKHRTGNLAVAFHEEQWVLLKADVTKAYRRIQVLPEEWKYQVARLGDKWWINMVGSISTQIRFQSSGHFRPALLGSSWSVQLLGQSSVLVRRTCWHIWRAGSRRNSRLWTRIRTG